MLGVLLETVREADENALISRALRPSRHVTPVGGRAPIHQIRDLRSITEPTCTDLDSHEVQAQGWRFVSLYWERKSQPARGTSSKLGHDSGSLEQIDCVERSIRPVGGCPVGVLAQVGVRISLDKSHDHLGHDSTANGTEPFTVGRDVCLSEDVESQRRTPLEVEGAEVVEVGCS
jgi:hypothetical protein